MYKISYLFGLHFVLLPNLKILDLPYFNLAEINNNISLIQIFYSYKTNLILQCLSFYSNYDVVV